jgi:hypothetical protein
MLRNLSFENFSLACLMAAASLAVAASALAYSVPRTPLHAVTTGEAELAP